MSEDIVHPLKQCTKCGNEYPATREFFNARTKTGEKLHVWCKACANQYARTYREVNGEQLRQNNRIWRQENLETVRENDRRRYANNPDKRKQNVRRWNENNHEWVIQRNRQWYAENRERQRLVHRNWYENNRSKVREANRRWKEANPERARQVGRIAAQRRRALSAAAPDTLTIEHEQRAIEYFNGCCAVCGRQLADLFGTHKMAFDHWIPLSKGGATTPDNMIPLCHGKTGCNNSKHNHLPDEWLVRKFGKRSASKILAQIQTYFEWVKTQSD